MKSCIWLILLIPTGCGVFKNKLTTVDKSDIAVTGKVQTELVENVELKRHDQSLHLAQNTADHSYAVKLWPKGIFTYSAENGFSGEADSVIIQEQLKTQQINLKQLAIEEVYNGKTKSTASANLKQVSNQLHRTEKHSVSWKWVAAGAGILLVGLSLWWYKKINSFNN